MSFFDEKATLVEKKVLIEKGVLKSYMYERLSAMKADALSRGKGSREA
ncbi:MAG: metallopeptidase TldD-related protein [Thermodesulfobacteriota bacterium]